MDTPAKVTLILDGDALSRLLGGNTELEVQLREEAIKQFLKSQLKAVLGQKKLAVLREELMEWADTEIEKAMSGLLDPNAKQRRGGFVVLRDDIRASISRQVKASVEAEITTAVKKILSEEDALRTHVIEPVWREVREMAKQEAQAAAVETVKAGLSNLHINVTGSAFLADQGQTNGQH